MVIGRNEPCPCGSGKKYKKCCLADEDRNHELIRAHKLSNDPAEIKRILSESPRIYELKVSLFQMGYNEIEDEISCVMEVSGKATLYDVHLEIQDAFDWDNDHMFSFFLGEDMEDRENEYSANPLGEHLISSFGKSAKSASDTEIRDIKLQEGQEFLYLFDYGDSLLHKVVVKSIKESNTPKPPIINIISKTGKAPDQYDY
jgi:hypothetical protein